MAPVKRQRAALDVASSVNDDAIDSVSPLNSC